MTTTVNLRKTLDRKQWEAVAVEPMGLNSRRVMAKSQLADQLVFAATDFGSSWGLYRPDEDAWLTTQLVAMPVALSGGACACHHPNGPTGTASAGSSTTITTTTTAAVNLAGYAIRITAGTGAGQEKTIVSNTLGANSVITTAAWGTQPDNTSVYLLLTGRFWYAPGGAGGLRYYDVATNTWSSAQATPTSVASDAMLIATPGYYGQTGLGTGMASGTATSGSATTIVNTGKAWATNQWANFQVRITAGTGAGKVATITSNTGTTLTFPTVTTVLDNTSQYIIEGNDDFLYFLGGGVVTLQRYSISGNSWSTLSPSPVRTNAPGAGTGNLVAWANACTDALFSVENAIVNGRRIYAFNATTAAAGLDYYDIPSNAWTNGVTVGRFSVGAGNLASTGTSGVLIGDNWYIAIGGTAVNSQAGQVLRLNIPRQTLDPWGMLVYPATTGIIGQRIFDTAYTDGGTTIRWIHLQAGGLPAWFRCMVI